MNRPQRTSSGTRELLALALAALTLGSIAPTLARAEAIIPHIDPLRAVKAMRHTNPTPQQLSPADQWQRYQDELTAAKEKAMKLRFQNAGPWEAIAAEVFGVYAKPDVTAPATPPPPTAPAAAPTPVPVLTPAIHSPVQVLPIPPKVATVSHAPPPQTDAQHSKDTTPAAVPTMSPAAIPSDPMVPAAAHPPPQPQPQQKPILSHDTVMKLIRRYTDAIEKFRAQRKAEEEKAQHIAAAAAAWAAANPLKKHTVTLDAAAAPSHPVVHHRLGVATHKQPPPPTHVLHAPPPIKPKPKHTQFVLKFTGVCVDNRTATELGKHHNPHHHQPLQHHQKYHRRGFHSDAEPSREIPWCSLKAQSQDIMTRIHPSAGVDMSVSKMVGSVARLDLFDLSILSETEFVARGNLSFGSTRHRPHSVVMESAGTARVFKFETGSRAITASFQVTGGSGGFDGHRGTLTLNGVLKSLNRVEALVTGVLYPPEQPINLTARRMSALKQSPFYRRATSPPPPTTVVDSDEDDDDDDDDDDDTAADTKVQCPVGCVSNPGPGYAHCQCECCNLYAPTQCCASAKAKANSKPQPKPTHRVRLRI